MKRIDLLFFLICLSANTTVWAQELPATDNEIEEAYQKRIQQSELDGVYIPKDIPDALVQLNKLVDKSSRQKFMQVSEEEATQKLFFSLGRWISYNWGFYGGSRLSHHLREFGVTYPDDMAQLLIVCFHRSLNKQPIEFKAEVAKIIERRAAEHKSDLQGGEVIGTFKLPAKDSLKVEAPEH